VRCSPPRHAWLMTSRFLSGSTRNWPSCCPTWFLEVPKNPPRRPQVVHAGPQGGAELIGRAAPKRAHDRSPLPGCGPPAPWRLLDFGVVSVLNRGRFQGFTETFSFPALTDRDDDLLVELEGVDKITLN
jgi:hypothetical protein